MSTGNEPVDLETHRARLLAQIAPLAPQSIEVSGGFAALHGAVLAEDVASAHPLPLWDNSAMDGYAVRSGDTSAAPVALEVIGEVPAGSGWDPRLEPGQCVKIMTGAPIPSDADAVARIEDTSAAIGGWDVDTVQVNVQVPPGKDIRRSGEDKAAGDLMAYAGETLSAARLSALAAAGASTLVVRTAPRVAVLVTGAELRAPGEDLSRGQIPETNSLLMAGLLAESGIQAATVVHCVDDICAVREQLDILGATHDAVLSTGGVGPGAYDVMRQVLEAEPGVQAARVKIRPGQPQCAGRLESGAMVFALPGNPVSAAVSFELFVRPCLRAMQGHREVLRPTLRAVAAVGWKAAAGRMQVIPVVFQHGPTLRCAPAVQASSISHSVGGFGAAQGYALVPAGATQINPGDEVEVLRMIP
ncbi:molybdopterin molybdotransferase MoeA [Glutamicibacter halophytocola]|uniref:molybdopterin molybdotransferase MoeA n=1 Tax=Glutamicibacter halophytocola TaxID=1933880 RepID=UPI0015C56ABE|nr:gephyrin-like molybdotransferase Glp [Glutamicibacter halophytocola]NQD39601.1 molybdopterin molybdotransferase MoeA [Glutamicibacter halophytocola]